MKGKAVIPLALGLCIGLVAVKFGVDAIRSAEAKGAVKKTITAVRAVEDIDATMEITAEMVQAVETVPNSFIPANDRPGSLDDVIGRVTAKAIPKGTPILKSMLAEEGTSPGMLGLIKPGFRAFSVKIDEVTGVAYQIKRGDWVDVLVVMDIQGSGRQKETIAEVILQHVQVAAVGRTVVSPTTEGKGRSKAAKSATLLIPDEDVPKLHLAATKGKISLAMRGSEDAATAREQLSARMSNTFEAFGANPEQGEAQGQLEKQLTQERLDAEQAKQALAEMNAWLAQAEVEPELPYAMTVYHGSASAGTTRIERVTFLNEESRTILDLSNGPVGRASSLMRQSTGLKAERRRVVDHNKPDQTTKNAEVANEHKPLDEETGE
jgi:pilus assembly protein CpaB